MGKASTSKRTSADRVAKLAAKGKGRQVRFKGGTLFPAVMIGVAVIGAALVIYSRESIPDRNVPPTVTDHWHVSYGFYACDSWLPDLQGNKEELDTAGQLLVEEFRRTGIHSHDDGVIHWHPYTSAATGRNAKLKVFLNVYGVKVTDTKIEFPADQGGAVYEEGETKCIDENGDAVDGEVVVYLYESYDDASNFATYITNFGDIRFDQDAMAVTIAFVPAGTNPGMPPSAINLPELGAVDTGQAPPTTIEPNAPVPADSGATTTLPSGDAATGATTTIAGPTTTTGG
ncbi:MAG: hypothetical protein ACO38D_05510 [Ilumatobacteraceae bacterium]